MNDPWTTLVETLSGQHRSTPHQWPARRIHRMMDDAPVTVLPPKMPPPLRPLQTPRHPAQR
jgi:hypothetical protein